MSIAKQKSKSTMCCNWRMPNLLETLACLKEGFQLSVADLAWMLDICTKERSPTFSLQLHTYILLQGLDANTSLSNFLVLMYVEINYLRDAQLVFDRSMHLNDSSWNCLITAHIQSGDHRYGLSLYHRMRKMDSIYLNTYTYIHLLKACSRLKDLESGRLIHVEVARTGVLNRDIFVGCALVDMYAKCGSFVKAQRVLHGLPAQNVIYWNALLAGYVKYAQFEEALNCLRKMQLAGVSPDIVTFVCVLKACSSMGDVNKGEELHDEICRKGLLGKSIVLGGTLVDMFARFGQLAKAHQVFDKLPVRDVVTWTALIAGYVEHGHSEKALTCFEQMQVEGVSPDSVSFLCTLKACASIRAISKGYEIHQEIERKDLLGRDIVLGSTLVDMYTKCGSLVRAQQVFNKFPIRNVVLWNALIAGYAEHGHAEEALNSFEQMKLEGILPDLVSYVSALKACCCIGAAHKGREIHAEIAQKELLESDHIIGSTLVGLYAKCGLLVEAAGVFDKLLVQDVVAWTTLMAGYSEHGHDEQALVCFHRMQDEGVFPNALTFVYSLKACGDTGATDKGQDMHAEIERKGLLGTDLLIGSTLIDMYAKCGFLSKAQQVFDKLVIRDVISWTPLIAGYAQIGECEHVFKVFDRMIGDGVRPDPISFVSVLNACSRTCLLSKSKTYFEAMTNDFGIVPNLEHHSCVVGLLGRSGQLYEAVDLVKKMQHCPNLVVWNMILGACANWGNANLGKQAFKHALHLDDKNAAGYVSMSGLCVNGQLPRASIAGLGK